MFEPDHKKYSPSPANILRAILFILLGRPRSLGRDGLLALRDTPLPPRVVGLGNVPSAGPVVVVANHYERKGLWMAWPAVLASAFFRLQTNRDIRWIAIQEWESYKIARVSIPPWVTRLVFAQAFGVYGIVPMAPPYAPAAARAASVRQITRMVRHEAMLGLMPEGTVGPTPDLLEPPEGVGAFLLMLAAAGARFLPMGIFEDGERLVLRIGEAFELKRASGDERSEPDRRARDEVMHRIRDLLPQQLWGAYRQQQEKALG